jgi:hypothetical protein
MAGGQFLSIAESFAALDVGTRIGSLPEGVSQTPIQDDMNRPLKKFNLEKYKTPVAETLELDLRENLRVKSEEAAFMGLERSIFLNRLLLLNIGFAQPAGKRQDAATWKEVWALCWTPEVEICLVESVIYGDTVEAAASFVMKEKLEKAADVLEVAELAGLCYNCRLASSMPDVLKKLQALASESESLSAAARAGQRLSRLIQSGNMRKFETSALVPILQQLFLKAVLLLHSSASCNYDTARDLADDMAILHVPNTDWKTTIRKNLKNYDGEKMRIIPEKFYFFENRRINKEWHIILDMDQSGSMADSIIYASIMGSIFAAMPSLDTRIVAFDTEGVDLTEKCGKDPVDILFGVQLGGGTDINKSVRYCAQFIENPKKTIFILISDLYEGGVEAGLLRQLGEMKESGLTVLALLALSDRGVPSYDEKLAAKIAALGIPSFGCTPNKLPELIAGALKGDDLAGLSERVKIGGAGAL